MAEIFHDAGADLSLIQSKKIATIGYGSQGHAYALNLRDSGVEVVVGLCEGSKSIAKAEGQGLEVASVADAAAQADAVMVPVPDQSQRAIWVNDIEPNPKEDAAVFFAHGFDVHYGYIKSGPTHDVCMVAPEGPGHIIHRLFEEGHGVPSLVCVEQDASDQAFELALSYVAATDTVRAGAIKTTFREETETDLFGEQTILCGGVSQLTQYDSETPVKAGYQPEVAYFEVYHETKLVVDLINEGGLMKQRWSYSDMAEYGDYVSDPRVIRPDVKDHMKEVPADVQNDSFAKRFTDDQDAGAPEFFELRAKGMAHPTEKTGQEIRKLFVWNNSSLDKDYTDGEAAY